MSLRITILVGTMTGTAQLCAQEMELALDGDDVPVNARAFYEDLKSKRPDLSRVRYGVFGLGDRTYAETFNFGGKRFDELLAELGAQRIGERHMHDASSGVLPEETALEWCNAWLAKAKDCVAAG